MFFLQPRGGGCFGTTDELFESPDNTLFKAVLNNPDPFSLHPRIAYTQTQSRSLRVLPAASLHYERYFTRYTLLWQGTKFPVSLSRSSPKWPIYVSSGTLNPTVPYHTSVQIFGYIILVSATVAPIGVTICTIVQISPGQVFSPFGAVPPLNPHNSKFWPSKKRISRKW